MKLPHSYITGERVSNDSNEFIIDKFVEGLFVVIIKIPLKKYRRIEMLVSVVSIEAMLETIKGFEKSYVIAGLIIVMWIMRI